ncbi:hypothetical protein Ga0100231_012035 [Opitutaceae bacterium TAV4]|nr:hypothetical protein Ga0100231_010720 [Opitutaceae bacterium TAV4]RRJ94944.1 hypothetical protein Ga0100231_012035 [Opitutaceae bacterium TAV4]
MHSQSMSSPVFVSISRSRFALPLLLSMMCAAVAPAQSVFNVSDTNGNFNANATWVRLSGTGTQPAPSDQIVITSSDLNKDIEVAFPNNGTVASLTYGTADGATDITRNIVFRGSGDVAHSLTITGDLTKYDSGTLTFRHRGSSGGELNLAIGGDVNLYAGTLNFGIDASGTRHLSNVSVGGVTQISGGTLNLRLFTDSSLGTLVLNGGALNLNAGGVVNGNRTISVRSLSGTGGTIGETTSGTGATFTLAITGETGDTADTVRTYSGAITNGTGTGAVALKKTGVATQIFAGANTYEGGTTIEQGTLMVTGSLAATGDVSVSSNATFAAGTALTVNNVALASGAILGLDLGANASLSIAGNLVQNGTGEATFTVDFLGTGATGVDYTNLLSVVGTNAFADATLNYVNFGAEKLSGTLTFAELAGVFSVAAGNIPEPTTFAVLLGVCALALAIRLRQQRR